MSEDYKLSDIELQEIATKMPPDIVALSNKYPIEVLNAAEFLETPPLPDNYTPKIVEIYYANTESPGVFIKEGKLENYVIREPDKDRNLIAVMLDYEWTYIQIEGKVILNRLGGVILPDVLIDPKTLIHSDLAG